MQTAYNLKMAVAVAGLLFDLADNTVESAAAEGFVPFGSAVVKGTIDNGIGGSAQVKVPSADGQLFRGIAVRDLSQPIPASGDAGYADTATVGYLRQGRIWVETNDAVALDAPAFFIHSGNGAGKFADAAAVATSTAVATADPGNTGDGDITGEAVTDAGLTIVGNYTVEVIAIEGADTTFVVNDPNGNFVGNGLVDTEFTGGGLEFTVEQGLTEPYIVGDKFTIAVAESFDADAVPTGVFRSATDGAGLAVLEINLP